MTGFAEFASGLPAGVGLRAMVASDRSFLYALFASTRADELSLVPWPDAQKEAFLQSQFGLQDAYYRQQYPAAEHLVVTESAAAIGRIVIDRTIAGLHLLDITLDPGWRGRGIGTALVSKVTTWGDLLAVPVSLYVEPLNPACRLYERLGFSAGELHGIRQRMERPLPPLVRAPAR